MVPRRLVLTLASLALVFLASGPQASLPPARAALTAAARASALPDGAALALLATTDAAALRATLTEWESRGVRPLHTFPPDAVIGFFPEVTAGLPGLRALYREPVDPASLGAESDNARRAAAVWNSLSAPSPLSGQARGDLPDPPPDDVRQLPLPPALEAQAGSAAPNENQVAEFLAGRVAVGIITPESNGQLDASTENWDAARLNQVRSKIVEGLTWWASVSLGANVQYTYDIHHQVPTRYEPINRNWNEDHLWISETLGYLGYSEADWWTRIRNYLNAIRSANGTDWAIVVFVVDSKQDLDGCFVPVPGQQYTPFAYTWMGSGMACVVMTYDNDGWGIDAMNLVMAHEFGHCFGACDEYEASRCSCTQSCGYLAVSNSNCEYGCTPQYYCLMRRPEHASACPYTRGQVGLRDSDGDGIPDPVDTVPVVSLDATSPLTNCPRPTLTGLANDIAWDSPTRVDVTINHIVAVEYQVDGSGPWLAAEPEDGAFNNVSERFRAAVALSTGAHTVRFRARNRWGNTSSLASRSVTVNNPIAPSSRVLDLPAETYSPARVRWAGTGPCGSAGYYDVQYATSPSGPWIDWLIGTTLTEAPFTATPERTYYFRSRAYDVPTLKESWPVSPDAFTYLKDSLRVYLPLVVR